MNSIPVRVIPLGGLGEVGRNMMIYQYGEEHLIVDAGMMFPESTMPGVDYIIPNLSYFQEKPRRVAGIVITHGHEDHIGSIHHLLEVVQAPIFATPLTRGLLEVKLARNGWISRAELETVQAGETRQIGPFLVTFFHVCHSIPDGIGLGIETPAGLIVHTGDYKFDHTPVDNWPSDYARLAEFSQRGVLALLADSTNSERPGWTPSERIVDDAFDDVFNHAKGRIIIASFASLVSRMQQVIHAACRHNRRVAFAGTSMIDNAKMAKKLGYLNIPEDVQVNLEQALHMPDHEVVIMCTGSQGEPSSILGRLSTGSYKAFSIQPGDTVVLSAHPIPGNEENVYRTINLLIQHGADVIYEAIAPVHVSGHASQEELKLMINLVRPKYFIPIHGELRHLKQHAHLAERVGIPADNIAIIRNGQVLEIYPDHMEKGEEYPGSLVFVDGSGVGDVDTGIMREREALSEEGFIVIQLVLDRQERLLSTPVFLSQGFMLMGEEDPLLDELRRQIIDRVNRVGNNLQKDVEKMVRNYLYAELHRSPRVFVTISQVG